MRTATVYIAVDGRHFPDPRSCKDHEERLFEVWLKEHPQFKDFLALPEDKAVRRAVIRAFWEWSTGSAK